MSKICQTLFLILTAFHFGATAYAAETSSRNYELPGYGVLELDIPKFWEDEVHQPPDNLPPTITMRRKAGDEFIVVITPFWNLAGLEDFNSAENIRKALERETEILGPNAGEEELVLKNIKGPETNGYYFVATDKAPKQGEWEYLVRAVAGSGDLLIGMTTLTHAEDSKAASDSLVMFSNLRQRKFKPPSHDQKMWALATCAVLAQSNRERHDLLGGCERTEGNINGWKEGLKEWWGVEGRKDLYESLVWIQRSGHRADFIEMGKNLSALSLDELEQLKSKVQNDPELLNKIDIASKHYAILGKKSLMAWDYSRYISLCGWGYVVGYMSEDEAWERIMPVAQILQDTFDSWEDLGSNHVLGREFWSLSQTQKRGELTRKAYKTLSTDPSSPWLRIPWDLNLDRNAE